MNENLQKNEKVYIVKYEDVVNGIVFNSKTRYIRDSEKANTIYQETIANFKEDNSAMLEDKENYVIKNGKNERHQYFYCFYKYQPEMCNVSIEMYSETLE